MPRKTHEQPPQSYVLRLASMRPRPDAAENDDEPAIVDASCARFNEAAARCRGKPH